MTFTLSQSQLNNLDAAMRANDFDAIEAIEVTFLFWHLTWPRYTKTGEKGVWFIGDDVTDWLRYCAKWSTVGKDNDLTITFNLT